MNTAAFSLHIPFNHAPKTEHSSHARVRPHRRPRYRPQTRISPPCACVEPLTSPSLPLQPPSSSSIPPTPTPTFRSLYGDRLPAWLVDRMESLSLTVPTPIQSSSLPLSIGSPISETVGSDVVLHAETGSGKTLAYLLPALASIKMSRNTIQSLILVPTPELVVQVAHVARRLVATSPVPIPVLPIIGDDSRKTCQQLRATAPRLIVAKTLTIKELLDTRRLRLDLVRCIVVDEFDAILNDPKSIYALTHILGLPSRSPPRQTILASATVPQHQQFLRLCISQHYTRKQLIHVAPSLKVDGRKTPQLLTHMYALCNRGKKLGALRALLDGLDAHKKAMVFVGKSRDALVLAAEMTQNTNRNLVAIDEDLMDIQRRDALAGFVSGEANVLVCSEIAARGLDVPDVDFVFHLDLPADADRYIHRAGRSARSGKKGTSVLLVENGEKFVLTRMANALDVEFIRIRGAKDISVSQTT